MGTFFRNKTNYNMSAVIGGVALAELLEGAATVWTAGQVLKDNYNEISSAAAVGMGYRGIGSIFGRNPNSTIDSTQLAAVQHLKKIIAVAGEPIPVGSYTNTKNMQPFIALAKAALKAANKLDKNKKTMISQAITAFPLIHFNSDGSTGERTGNTSMQRAALWELGRYMGKEVDIHPFAMTGKDMSGIALDGMVDRMEIYRQKAKMAHLYLNPSTTLAALGVHWEKGLVNGAACEVVPTDPAFLGGAGQSLVLPLAASNLASTVNIATSAVTAGNEADFLIKASATRRFSEGSQLYARLSIHIDSHGSAPGAISSHQLPITAYAARDGGMYTRVATIAATSSPQGGVATAQVAVIDVPLSEYSKTSKYNGRSDYSTLTEHVRLVHDHPDNLSAAGYVLRVYPMGVFAKPTEARVANPTGALYFSDEEHGRNFISGTKSFCSSFGRNVIGFREPFGVGKVWEDFLSQHSGIVTLWVEINRAMRKDGTWWNAYREAWIDIGVSDEDAVMDTFLFEIDQWPYTAGGWPGDEDSNYRVMRAVRYIIGMFLDPATVPSSFDTVVHAVRSAN